MMVPLRYVTLVCLTLVLGMACGGCGEKKADPQIDHMKPLSVLYSRFKAQNRGRAPKNEDEFKKFVTNSGADMLQQFHVTDADSLLKSTRDGQPFVIAYGNTPSGRIVAYESVGLNGKRWAADDLGKVEEMDEATLKQMVPNFK